jgi:programmed cell death protein 4
MALEQGHVDVDLDNDIDIDKVVDEELATKETVAGGDGSNIKQRRAKKVHRQLSKDNVVASGFIHGPRSWKNSRRSRNGYGRGLPKKGGAGGKGVWGLPGSELLETYEDVNDPNFDNENLSNGDIELKAIGE